MLYSCGVCGWEVDIPAPQIFYLSDAELERLCLYGGRANINNPWTSSILETGIITHRKWNGIREIDDPEAIEEYESGTDEDTSTDIDWSLTGIDTE